MNLYETKIVDEIVKPKPFSAENPGNLEEIFLPPEKEEDLTNKKRRKMEHHKLSELLNDSTLSKLW